uniref:Fibrillin 1 n=1 Tax=Strix occidentalis caurina TaxID=311401 RepID=A0A8D0EW85_STROC
CVSLPGTCSPGTCQNLEGSFRCICPPGYEVQNDNCIDINECEEEPNICLFGTCTNTPGSFQCVCPPGFVLSDNGRRCFGECSSSRGPERVDVFLSLLQTMCQMSSTNRNLVTKSECCCNSGRSWGPQCELWYSTDGRGELGPKSPSIPECSLCMGPEAALALTDPSLPPADIDECKVLPNLCKNGQCINSIGSFRCHCRLGYTADITGTACVGELGEGNSCLWTALGLGRLPHLLFSCKGRVL